MMRCIRGLGLAALTLAICLPAARADGTLKTSTTGNPKLLSIDVLSFGPNGILFIGDGKGSQVVVVDTGDASPGSSMKAAISDIDTKLAERVGTTAKGIEIAQIAVNPASGKAYFAVRRQDARGSMILTVDGAGKVQDLPLENVKYAKINLPVEGNAPLAKVTDIAYTKDKVLVSGRANEQFASKIFIFPAEIEHDSKAVAASAETYHVAHAKWETKAPMETIIPYFEDGKAYVVGAFTCTPLVKYPLESVKPGATVKGISMVELGNGNMPYDMFVYEKGGKQYVLVNTIRRFGKPFGDSKYWTARVDLDLLRGQDKINENAQWRIDRQSLKAITDKVVMVKEFGGVVRMDRLDADHALAVKENSKGGLDLVPLPLP